VPNGSFISGRVTNWTFSDRQRAVKVSVNVVRGTDPQRVVELLKSAAAAHPGAAKEPSPQVYVTNFSQCWCGNLFNFGLGRIDEDWAQLRSDLSVALNSVSSGHYVQNSEAKTLSGESRWIGEKRLIDRGQCEFGTALCEQHFAGARANNTFFR
jgi:hypothetical protein